MKSYKAEIIMLMCKLVFMMYNSLRNITKYVLKMSYIVSKLRELQLDLPKEVMVYCALMSLPPQFNHFEATYNCKKEKWTVNKFNPYLVQEEDRIRHKKIESTNFSITSKDSKERKGKLVMDALKKKRQKSQDIKNFFYKDPSHVEKDYPKYYAWHVKKGVALTLVCLDVNLILILIYTWQLNSGATAHISISMQSCRSYHQLSDDERFSYVVDGNRVKVQAISIFKLSLKNGFVLELNETVFQTKFGFYECFKQRRLCFVIW